MSLLQKIGWPILILSYASCSDDKPEPLISSWHEDAETAEKQLSAIETTDTFSANTFSTATIYNASVTNTTLVGNGRGPLGSLTGSPNNLTLTNSVDDFNTSGFISKNDINTLKGSSLSSKDTITATLTVPSISDGQLRSNGIQFGIVKAPSFGKTPDTSDDLHIEMEASNAGGKISTFLDGEEVINSGYKATTDELMNGFTATLVANVKEYTFTLVSVSSTDPLIVSGTFSGTQFVNLLGSGHFYFSAQQFNTKESLVSSITQASLEITPKP